MGFAFVPMQAASYATIPPAQNGRASSLFSTQRQVGVSFGIAVLASVLSSYGALNPMLKTAAEVEHALTGVHIAFAIGVLFAMLAAFFAFFIRDSDAKATMASRVGADH